MIRFIVTVVLFFTILALSPLLIDEKGYILIAMGETIIELTVLSAAILLILFSISAFIIFKIVRGSFNVWYSVVFASKNRGIANFNKGLTAYILEDYPKAEQLFAKSAEPAKRQHSAYLLAASASAKQESEVKTNRYLTLLTQETAQSKEQDLDSIIVKAKLLLNQKRSEAYKEVRKLIDENHKQIGHDARLLALEIDLCLIEKRFEAAIDYLKAARKEKSISDNVVKTWEEKAYYGAFNNIIRQQNQVNLQAYWNTLKGKIKQREAVLFAYCQVLAEQNITEPLTKLITPMLKKQPSANFLKQLRTLPIKENQSLIALVQKHLHEDSKNAKWLSCLGHLAAMSEQWSMAEKAFGSLMKLEANQQKRQYDTEDLQAFAKTLAKEGKYQAANEVWLKLSELTAPTLPKC